MCEIDTLGCVEIRFPKLWKYRQALWILQSSVISFTNSQFEMHLIRLNCTYFPSWLNSRQRYCPEKCHFRSVNLSYNHAMVHAAAEIAAHIHGTGEEFEDMVNNWHAYFTISYCPIFLISCRAYWRSYFQLC